MLKTVVNLDTDMTAATVLERLASQGFWTNPNHPAAFARLESVSKRTGRPIDEVARLLGRDARRFGAAVRRQWGARVLWYPLELQEVLDRCSLASPESRLIEVLNLHETDASPTIDLRRGGETILGPGVVMDAGTPVAVSLPESMQVPPSSRSAQEWQFDRAVDVSRSATAAAPEPSVEKRTWPRIDAPEFVPAGKPFDVVVGFSGAPQSSVAGGPVILQVDHGVKTIDLIVELAATGVQAPQGWSRLMSVAIDDVLSAKATFELVGIEPPSADRPLLTMLEVRFVRSGTVCGTAVKPLVILRSDAAALPSGPPFGEAWQAAPVPATPLTFSADDQPPDLTIEITKPDRNDAGGHYVCQLISPHSLGTYRGPFEMDLGQDAKTFAKSNVDEIRLLAGNPLLDNTLESYGRLVASLLPNQVFDALREVAVKVRNDPPAVLIVSAEPYVPWELAWMEPPLDSSRPSYLGAQTLVGRWLRGRDPPAPPGVGAVAVRPATHPVAKLAVRNIAVMAAWYKEQSGLRRLPKAEDEAKALVDGWRGIPLAASAQAMRQLLNATIERDFERIGAVEAVHFAGHGDFDPSKPEGSALFLMDGTPLQSTVFRSAKYGGECQPLMFLNACMLGIGGELLGDMAGFPGNSLRGGFGAVLGALWEVDDQVAHDVALEFWRRALPAPSGRGEPVGAILREMRAKYVANAEPAPVSTYLAYVYYGHPRLTLERAGP